MAIIVNGERISEETIQREADRLRPQYYMTMQREKVDASEEALEAQLLEWSRENMIEQAVLRQAALAAPDTVPAERRQQAIEAMMGQFGGPEQFEKCMAASPETAEEFQRNIELQLRVEHYLEKLTERTARPKSAEIGEYYVKHRDSFTSPEMVRARHIVIHLNAGMSDEERTAARAAIESAKAELDGGASFIELADRHSDCKGNGGDLGLFPRGEMVESFENVVFALEPGAPSPIFETEFGYHIALVEERRPQSVRPQRDVQDQIAERLLAEKKERIIEEHLDLLMKKATVETVEEPQPQEAHES